MKFVRTLAASFAIVGLVGASMALAAEPAWWAQQKATCGLPASTAYNDWAARGYPCNSGSTAAPASGDPLVQAGAKIGTALGNLVGNAIIQAIQEGNSAREAWEQAIAEAKRAHDDAEVARLAEQERIDGQRYKQAVDQLRGKLKLADQEPVPPGMTLKMDSESASLAPGPTTKIPDPDPQKSPRTAAYLKGRMDASQCLPQNAGGYCVGLSAADTLVCTDDYHGGYRVGESSATVTLTSAYSRGEQDWRAKREYTGLDSGIEGSCGAHAVEAYSSGFYNRPFTMIGR